MKRLVLSLVLFSVTSAGAALAEETQASAPVPAAGQQVETVAPAAEPAVQPPVVATATVPAVAPAAPVTAAVPLTSLPPTRRYRDEEVPPPGYVLEEQVRRGLLIPGVAVVGALYLTGIITTGVLQSFPNKTGFLAVPVAGPWITLAARSRNCVNEEDDSLECSEDQALDRLLVLDGLFQAVGTALIVTGITWTKSVWVREDLANIHLVPGINVAKMSGLPQPNGLSVVGQF
jgi:hypothetical protein